MAVRIEITKNINAFNKPEIGKIYDVVGYGITRWGTELRYIRVDGELVGIKRNECGIIL